MVEVNLPDYNNSSFVGRFNIMLGLLLNWQRAVCSEGVRMEYLREVKKSI